MSTSEHPPPAPPGQALTQMRLLRDLVRHGMHIEEAAEQLEVDIIIARLWVGLPEDLFSPPPTTPPLSAPAEPTIHYVTEIGANGLKRIRRVDGKPLCSAPPEHATRALREQREAAERRWYKAVRSAESARRAREAARVRPPVPLPDAAPNGDELRRWRVRVGLTQRALAAASGLSRSLIAEVERGRRGFVLTRLKMAHTLTAHAGVHVPRLCRYCPAELLNPRRVICGAAACQAARVRALQVAYIGKRRERRRAA